MNSIRDYILEADPLTSYTDVTDEWKRAGRKVGQVAKWATDPERRRARMSKKARVKKLKFQKKAEKFGTKTAVSAMKKKMAQLRGSQVYNPVKEDWDYKIDPEALKKYTTTKQKIGYLKTKIKHRKAKGKAQRFATSAAIKDIKRGHKSQYSLKNY